MLEKRYLHLSTAVAHVGIGGGSAGMGGDRSDGVDFDNQFGLDDGNCTGSGCGYGCLFLLLLLVGVMVVLISAK